MNDKRKLRVLIVIPNLFVAGAQKMVEQLVSHLDYSRFDVKLIVLSAPASTYLEESVGRSGAELHYLNKKPGFHIRTFFQAWKLLGAFHPDVIHTHLRGWIYLAPWILLHRIKVLNTIHSRPTGYESKALLPVMKWLYLRSKFILVAISDRIAEEAVGVYGLPPERIETVFNPVSFRRFSEAERVAHTAFQFVLVARFDSVKNHLFLIDVFSQVRRECGNVRLLLAGEGELMELKHYVNFYQGQINIY
jgi:glycosyltransferase involved in cell wall biosynthesis